MAFFSLSEVEATKRPAFRTPRCGQCGLFRQCNSPKMPVYGKGKRGILVVGEAPGGTEDRTGKPFQGKAGERLQKTAARLGVDLFYDCWVTNALRCRPPSNKINSPKAVDFCRPYVLQAVRELKPKVVLVLGAMAVRSVVGHLWREDPGGVNRWAGFQIPAQRFNAWVCPTFHPSHLDRMKSANDPRLPLAERYFTEHLAAAFNKQSRPWEKVPDYKSEVSVMQNPVAAEAYLEAFYYHPTPLAFDFETTTLKPDGPDAEIVSCAVSDGSTTIAYPWLGKAIDSTKEILWDPKIPKIGYNLKFEDRWSRAKLGRRVRGWVWDGQTAAHALDARGEGTSSLKFQAFARLGQEDYSTAVAPFLKADGGGNTKNRIRQVNLPRLLLYNGLDALLEVLVARHQAKEMGVSL